MNATVSWNAVTTNADGTPITDLAGYVVSHGISSGVYTPGDTTSVLAPITSLTFTFLDVGITHYFNVQAFDTVGNLSAFGGEVTKLEPYPVYPLDWFRHPRPHEGEYVWQTELDDRSSAFIADVLGLNLPAPEPPPPDSFPIYEAIGGFQMI